MAGPGQCFISYAHDDHEGFGRLLVHVRAIAKIYDFKVWHDRRLKPGFYWNDVIKAEIARSDIFVLLVTNGFIASDYIYHHEWPAIRARHQNGDALVAPVIYQESCWRQYFGNYIQVAPMDAKSNLVPVCKWPDREEAFAVAANAITSSIEEWFGVGPTSAFQLPDPARGTP